MDPALVAAKLADCKDDGWTGYRRTVNTWDRHVLVTYTGCYYSGTGNSRVLVYQISAWGPNDGGATYEHLRGNH